MRVKANVVVIDIDGSEMIKKDQEVTRNELGRVVSKEGVILAVIPGYFAGLSYLSRFSLSERKRFIFFQNR